MTLRTSLAAATVLGDTFVGPRGLQELVDVGRRLWKLKPTDATPQVTDAESDAGTELAVRGWSPADIERHLTLSRLDELAFPNDGTTHDATLARPGLAPKLTGQARYYRDETGTVYRAASTQEFASDGLAQAVAIADREPGDVYISTATGRTWIVQSDKGLFATQFISSPITYGGQWDPASAAFPTASVEGQLYVVEGADTTIDGTLFKSGMTIIAKVDGASTTTIAANWDVQAEQNLDIASAAEVTAGTSTTKVMSVANTKQMIDELENGEILNTWAELPIATSVLAGAKFRVVNDADGTLNGNYLGLGAKGGAATDIVPS